MYYIIWCKQKEFDMKNTEAYYFSEDYLVPTYDAPYDTNWVAVYNGQDGIHSYKINLIAVAAIRGKERESMKESIARDIAGFKKELEKNPQSATVISNIKYLEKLLTMFDTLYEKDICHVRTRWQELNTDSVRNLRNANMNQFDIKKAVFFTGVSGIKTR